MLGLGRLAFLCAFGSCSLAALAGCGGAPPARAPAPPPATVEVEHQIVTAEDATSERELAAFAERALREGRFAEAARAYELLVAAADSNRVEGYRFNLGTAYEGLGERAKARDTYRELVRRSPESPYARASLVRIVDLLAYLEEWEALGVAGNELLARRDLEVIERILGLGARALSQVERGSPEGAAHDIQEALDIVEEMRIGEGGRLPNAVAQLRFALGEMRRLRAERIELAPVDNGFGGRLEARCQGLLDAQSSFAQAMHAQDPHWAAMAGYRVGRMYTTLHQQVIVLPAPGPVRTDNDRQIFYAATHLRYRILLDKALRMMNGTLDLASKVNDTSPWVSRAEEARAEIEKALAEEKATIAKFPFTEEEMQRAVKMLIEKGEQAGNIAAAKGSKKGARSAAGPGAKGNP